jgi:hypothetical protein
MPNRSATACACMLYAASDGRVRGYANIAGGLRRHIGTGNKTVNQLINTPVQGSAGVIFREAVVRLYQHFRGTATMLILRVHDAVVIECVSADYRSRGGAGRSDHACGRPKNSTRR